MTIYPPIPTDTNGIPIEAQWVPNVGWVPIQAGTPTADINGIVSAPINVIASVTATPPSAVVSVLNSTTTLLTAGSVYTGTGESALAYGSLSVQVFTDHTSAVGGLVVQQSQDNTNWDFSTSYSVSASTAFQQTINLVGQYYRITYTNGGTNQGVFRLQTIKEVGISPAAGVANQRVSSQSGDIADGASVTQGTSTDANTVNTVMGRLTKIRDVLLGLIGVQPKSASLSVTIASDQGAIAVSSSSLPLPTGASTSAKQPALGAAGTASTDVISVQGIVSMTPIKTDGSGVTQPVSGTVTATNASVSATAAAVPGSATYMGGNKAGNIVGLALDGSGNLNVNVAAGGASGGTSSSYGSTFPTTGTAIGASDGTNMQALLVESSSNKNLRTGIYSGANEATVTGSNALKVDGSAVTQPVSNVSLPLPTGASTSAKQPVLGTAGTASTDVISVQGITSMTPIKTDGSGVTQPVSATSLPLPTGAAQEAGHLATIDSHTPALGQALAGSSVPVVLTAAQQTALTPPAAITGFALDSTVSAINTATGAKSDSAATDSTSSWSVIALLKGIIGKLLASIAVTQSGAWTVQPGNTANTTAWKVDGSAVSQPIVQPTSATGTPTSVAGNASAVSLLASNTSRKGAYVYNESSAILYLGLFAHASLSTTAYMTQVPPGNLFELPPTPVYTGEISGIWASATGNARITEMS